MEDTHKIANETAITYCDHFGNDVSAPSCEKPPKNTQRHAKQSNTILRTLCHFNLLTS